MLDIEIRKGKEVATIHDFARARSFVIIEVEDPPAGADRYVVTQEDQDERHIRASSMHLAGALQAIALDVAGAEVAELAEGRDLIARQSGRVF